MRKDFAKKLQFFPLPVLIIGTYDKDGKPNAMNAAWGGQSDTYEISICLSNHKTTDNLKVNDSFTVAFATKDTLVESDYFGIASGKNVDKIAKANFEYEDAKFVHAPIFKKYPVTLECKVKLFEGERLVGEVVNLSVDEAYLDKDGLIDYDKCGFISYDPSRHTYRELGKVVGFAFKDGKKLM